MVEILILQNGVIKINQWQPGSQMIAPRFSGRLAEVRDNFVIYMGGMNLG